MTLFLLICGLPHGFSMILEKNERDTLKNNN